MNNKLTRLDFAPGLKASEINNNFEIIKDWIERERLRIGGYGLVEGFELEGDTTNYTVTIKQGILINEDGEEIIVPESTILVGAPDYIDVDEEVYINEYGEGELSFIPYSPTLASTIVYSPPFEDTYPDRTELFVSEIDTGTRVPILSVVDNIITVRADNWANKRLKVTYKYSKDRIDSILLKKDGTYVYQKGILSTSPSHVDIEDYEDCYVIGFAYWQLDRTFKIKFYDTHRTYRVVYVDKNNQLYLNGKPYKDAQIIYFTEPENPLVDDIWYDRETNTLYIWQEKYGVFGWVIMNDISSIPIREAKMWSPEECPEDMQTFIIDDQESNLRFIPGTNALEIVIDNVVLMNDQFEEIIVPNEDKPYLSNGIGFKLKDPLDRQTHVQMIVHHSIRSTPLRETFQRAATFVDENFTYYNEENIDKTFTTTASYILGEHQLEVFHNGIRLLNKVDFVELTNDSLEATNQNKGEMSTKFKIVTEVKTGDNITYKITKNIYNYEQLSLMVDEIENKADNALIVCSELQQSITELSSNVANQLSAVNKKIDEVNIKLAELDNFIQKDDTLSTDNMPDDVMNRLKKTPFNLVKGATEDILINDVTIDDFIFVFYMSQQINRPLIKDVDYMLEQIDNDVMVMLHSDLMSSGASIYITGVSFGT